MEKLNEYIKKHRYNKEKSSSFVEYLYYLMEKYSFNRPPDLYAKAFISRQLWSSIISSKSNPSLNVCIKLALVMHVNNHECKYLLKKAGYALASNSDLALIIRYAIENKIYDLYEVDELLSKNGFSNFLFK